MNHNVMRTTRPASKAPVEITLTFWQHFYTPLGCASCRPGCTRISTLTHTQGDTLIYPKSKKDKQTDTQASKHPSMSSFSAPYPFSPSCFFSLSLLRFHIQNTQPLRWGNWMWQQILRGLLAGYQVNLWNVTHLTPAGWLWHLQETRLNHSRKDWRLNTVASSSSVEVFSLFMHVAE